ncbi:hypothetical protein EVAR_81587_1 [Eumeta japonica]|uniref:Uncharacterized protein n=1 Tax=Eumeta variegata TaxID=151549 RepID=A0A4C1UZD0_EUMVA|nr:hypothetical protein EVAR_81587_1 [Eumeta japonica]
MTSAEHNKHQFSLKIPLRSTLGEQEPTEFHNLYQLVDPPREEPCHVEQQVGEIVNGKFLEERNVMCYIACVYSLGQVVKNNKLILDNMLKQVDLVYPADEKDGAKAAMENCRGVETVTRCWHVYLEMEQGIYWRERRWTTRTHESSSGPRFISSLVQKIASRNAIAEASNSSPNSVRVWYFIIRAGSFYTAGKWTAVWLYCGGASATDWLQLRAKYLKFSLKIPLRTTLGEQEPTEFHNLYQLVDPPREEPCHVERAICGRH